jgi:hypothetical protein
VKDVDEMNESHLLAPLLEEPPGFSEIDVPRAMADGRRLRRRRRQWAGGVAVAAAVVLVAAGGMVVASGLNDRKALPSPVATAPAPPTGCTVAALPFVGQERTWVKAGDPTGHYLAGNDLNSHRVLIWKDGALVSTSPHAEMVVNGVNSHGVAVGGGYDHGVQHARVYQDGTVTQMSDGESDAKAINSAGVIVGSLDGNVSINSVPARWASAGAAAERLPLPAGMMHGEARGITEDGTIWGLVSKDTRTDPQGMLWFPDGTSRLLSLPAVAGVRQPVFQVDSIIGGWAYGTATAGSDFIPERYNIAEQSYEGLPGIVASNGFGTPAAYAENGWALTTKQDGSPVGNNLVILARSKSMLLPAPDRGEPTSYDELIFSFDGHVAAATASWSVTPTDPRNVPLMWTCR